MMRGGGEAETEEEGRAKMNNFATLLSNAASEKELWLESKGKEDKISVKGNENP